MASGDTGNVVPGNRLWVRVPCPPLGSRTMAAAAVLLGATILGGSGRAADQPPLLAVPGNVLFEDDFARDDMAPKWSAKGWTVAGGAAKADERATRAGGSGATCKAEPRFVYHDVIVEFDFQFEATKVFHVEMKDKDFAGTHAGHICCMSIYPGEIRLSDYKHGVMENGNYERLADKTLSKEEKLRLREELLATHSRLYPFPVEKGRWYRVRLEIVADEMLLSIDGTPIGYIRAPGVDHATRNIFGLTTRGTATHLRNVRVREATVDPGWAARRDAVVGSLKRK